jgi:hypothetical protein
VKFYIWRKALYGAEILTLQKIGEKYLESLKCWCRMGKIICTDRVKNEEVLHRINKEINILRTIKRRKVNWSGHTLSSNYLLKHGIEGKIVGRIVVMGRRGRKRKQLLDDLKKNELTGT